MVLVGGLIVTVACFVLFPGKYHEGLILNNWVWTQSDDMKGAIFLLSDSRFCIAAVSLIQLCIIAVGFLIWAMWLILSRVIYAAERYRVLSAEKVVWDAGCRVAGTRGQRWWLDQDHHGNDCIVSDRVAQAYDCPESSGEVFAASEFYRFANHCLARCEDDF